MASPLHTKAAVVRSVGGPLKVEHLDLQRPRPGEVLVEMHAAGVCRSDLQVITGATPHVLPVALGHEGAGVVLASGAGELDPGTPVALSWAPACEECFYCAREKPALCETFVEAVWAGVMPDGTPRMQAPDGPVFQYCALGCFATRVVVPATACIPMDHRIPLPVAALIGCCVTTGVGAVLNTARVEPGASVVVVGAGGVGLSAIQGAGLAQAAPVIAIDSNAARKPDALRAGASMFLVAGPDALPAIRSQTADRGVDYAFECTGVPSVQQWCVEAVRPGGTVVLVGLAPVESRTGIETAAVTRQEKALLGSYYGSAQPKRDFGHIAQRYLEGVLELEWLITRTYKLTDVNQALGDLASGELTRGVITFDPSYVQ